jgi:hypothetical protein
MDKFLLTFTYAESDMTHYIILWAINFDEAIQKLQFLYPGVLAKDINAIRYNGIEEYSKDHYYFNSFHYKSE